MKRLIIYLIFVLLFLAGLAMFGCGSKPTEVHRNNNGVEIATTVVRGGYVITIRHNGCLFVTFIYNGRATMLHDPKCDNHNP